MKPAELELIFARIPQLDGMTVADFRVSRVAGFTNINYRLRNNRHDWILRIPKPATDRFIDRDAEAINQNLACQLGIAPAATWRDSTGLSLTAVLEGTREPMPAEFNDDGILRRLLAPIQKLHGSDAPFKGQVDLAALLDSHFEMLKPNQQQQMRPRLEQARRVLKLLENNDATPVPSHNDLVLGNLLLDADRVWLIDWEYSAMASPYWDLATLCNATDLDLAQSRHLMHLYCAGGPLLKESILFDYRGLLKLLSDCWIVTLAR